MPTSEGAAIASGVRVRAQAEIRERARRAASGFERLGVGEGDAVALLLRNDFAFFEAGLAAGLIGARAVPLNWHAGADELADRLVDCGARIVVAHDDLAPALPRELTILRVATPPEIRAAYGLPEAATHLDRAPDWDGWLATHPPREGSAASAPPATLYTSGTTGPPKAIRRAAAPAGHRSGRALAVYGLDFAPPMRVLINGPMYHSVANAYGRLALQVGADIVLQAKFDPAELLALVARHRITHMHVTPAMMVQLWRLPEAVKAGSDLSSLRYVVHGAAPCPPTVKAACLDWLGDILHEYYGSTETGLLTRLRPADARRKPGSVGRALPDVRLEIRDGRGRNLPAGSVGDVFAMSPATDGAAVTAGDIGSLDADGFLFLRGRGSEMIRSRGGHVHPAAVEAVLLGLDGVKDCAVFGLADDEGGQGDGELVCACVEPLPGAHLDADTLGAELAGRLAEAERPSVVEIVAHLPREDSGKIFKSELRRRYSRAVGRRPPGSD